MFSLSPARLALIRPHYVEELPAERRDVLGARRARLRRLRGRDREEELPQSSGKEEAVREGRGAPSRKKRSAKEEALRAGRGRSVQEEALSEGRGAPRRRKALRAVSGAQC